MPNHKIYKLLLTFFISINLVACGGGSDSGGGVSAQTSSQLMAKYSGIKDSASLTVDEIYPTLNYLFNGDTSGFEGITSKSYATAKSSRSFTTRATESFGCSYGGSVTINESLNQKTGIGQVIYDYDNCDGGDYSISGQLVFDYKQWGDDWEPEKYDIIYNEYREEYPDGTYFALDGSIVVWEPSSCYTQTTSNLLYQTDKMSVLERDLKSFNNGCPVETIYIGEIGQAIEGRVYFGAVGYVDIATEDRLNFDESQQVVTGKLSLSNENTLIVLETNDSITSLTVNSYNDPSLDYSASSLSWNYTEQAYSEVRDDDLDGYANVDDFYPDNAELFEPLTISDSNITFSYVYGSNNIISDKLSINGTNIGWSLTSNADWLTLVTSEGVGAQDIEFEIDNLSAGEHSAQLTLISDLDGSEQTINVIVNIVLPTLSLSEAELIFDGTLSSLAEYTKSLQMYLNTGTESYELSYEVELEDFFTVDAPDSIVEGVNDITFSVDPSELVEGTYSGEVIFKVNVLGEEISSTISVSITAPKHLLLVPQSAIALSSFDTVGKLSAEIDVLDNYGLTTTSWSATTTAEWLTLTTTGSTADKLIITVDPSDLAVDTFYSTSIVVSSTNSGIDNSQTINVGFWGGELSPSSQSFSDDDLYYYKNITADPLRPYIYVNRGDRDIDIFNVYTQRLVSTISDVGISLSNMEVTADAKFLYVTDTLGTVDDSDNSMIIIELDDTSNRKTWDVEETVVDQFTLSVTNNKELLISDSGNIYDAETGKLYLSGLDYDDYRLHLDASLFGNHFCAINSGNSYNTSKCYELQYLHASDQVIATPLNESANSTQYSFDIALNHEGTIAYIASKTAGGFIQLDLESMLYGEIFSSNGEVPVAVDVGPDNAIHGGVNQHYASGDDIVIYKSDNDLRKSESLSAYEDTISEGKLVVSGDGYISIALTDNATIMFMASY